MRKTKHKTFSLRSRTTSLLLALLLMISAASVGFVAIANAVTVDDDSGGLLAMTGAGGKVDVASGTEHIADSNKAFWVDAQYYDYLSDEEYSAGWLNPKEAGTGFDSADDDWYTFETFNKKISDYAKGNSVKMTYPLYFGNFCNTVSVKNNGSGDYIDSAYEFTIQNDGNDRTTRITKTHGGPYARVIDGLYHYDYFIANSNGLNDRHDSVIGLAGNNLNSSGNITTPTATGSVEMPYFNESWLGNAARTINSYFPFRQTTSGDVTTYSFDSTGAKDNVFFNWNNGQPSSVAYGQGVNDATVTEYGVHDGLKKFMGDQDAGYGIFPFNRADNGNGGNNKLDYGFGIRMNMDFRVPANGKIGNKDVKFNYSGDDDIWIYITPYKADGTLDYANSYLALDLGGNHKMAKGEINFASMESTITTNAAYASSSVTYKSDTMYIARSDGWSDVNVWAWSDTNNGHWVTGTKQSFQENGHDVYAFKLSDFNGCYNFTTVEHQDWSGKRATNEGKNLNCVIHSQLGNVCWSDNPNWIAPKYPDNGQYTNLAGVTYATTEQKTQTLNNGQHLDPDKTYHMTIFYMERGMIESNCQMSFTMTPVKNDLKVKKTVDVSEINSNTSANSMRTAIQALPFSFTTTEDGSVRKDTKFVRNQEWYSVDSSTGVYQLKHDEIADFNNQHETGSTLTVNETPPSGLEYSTSWQVVDNNNNGNVIKQSGDDSSLGTGNFTLIDPRNSSAPANLQVNFTNTPEASPSFTISKKVFENESDIFNGIDDIDCDAEFEFLLKFNLKGENYTQNNANDFKAYTFDYEITRGTQTINGTATNGSFKIKAGDIISIPGVPVGATYRLQEIGCDGYSSVAYSHNGENDERLAADAAVNGIVNSDGDEFCFDNVGGMASTTFAVQKYIKSGSTSTQYKNGSLFTFRAKGRESVTYASGKTSVDASAQTYNGGRNYVEVGTINENGLAIFENGGGDDPFLTFRHAGVYVFEVWESGVNSTDNKLKDTFRSNSQRFLVKYTVTAQGSDLLINDPEYFTYDGGAVNAASFADNKKITTDYPQFVNEVKTGKIKINKKDGAGTGLGNIQFKLYRKGETTEIATLTTNSSGYAEKDGLDIFVKSNGIFTGTPAYQEYELKETSTKSGHMLEDTVYTFSFPTYDAQAQTYKYEYTFDYVNAALKHPETGSFGMMSNTPLGIALVFLSFVGIGLYIAKLKRKQLSSVQTKRFL